MTKRFYYKALIPVAMVIGVVVLTMVGLGQGWFGPGRISGDNREPTGDAMAASDNMMAGIAEVEQQPAYRPEPMVESKPVASTTMVKETERGKAAATNNEMMAAVAEVKRRMALRAPPSPAASARQSDDEDQSLVRSPDEVAPRVIKPMAEPTLVAGATTVRDTADGPVATIQFSRTTAEPIGPVEVVVFLPPGSDAKILDFSPAEGTGYSEADKRIAENGWFAAFRGVPQGATDLSFDISISQPAVAIIKGNCGIEPFEIDLQPVR